MSDKCPYCGTALTQSLNFCVNCRRAVTEDKLKQFNTSEGFDDQVGLKAFKLSKKEYSTHRSMRTFFFSLSVLMMLFLMFFLSMKYIVQKPIPGEAQLTGLVRQLTGGGNAQPEQE